EIHQRSFKDAEVILETVERFPFFTPSLIELATRLSMTHFTSLGMVFAVMALGIKFPPKRKSAVNQKLQQAEMGFCDSGIVDRLCSADELLFIDETRKPGNYLRATEKFLERGLSVVVLLPHLSQIDFWVKRLSAVQAGLAVLHSELPPGRKYLEWEKILAGSARVIIGTRQAVFAPVKTGSVFLVFDEESAQHREESRLCYRTSEVTRLRREIEGAKVIISSCSPSAATFQTVTHKLITGYPQPVDKIAEDFRLSLSPNVINNIVFEELIHRIKSAPEGTHSQILFPGSGYIRSVICGKCGLLMRCGKCGIPLHFDRSIIFCPDCRGELNSCPGCGASSFRFGSGGREKIADLLKKKLGGEYPIQIIDSSDLAVDSKSRVLITPLNIYFPQRSNCEILALLHPDILLLQNNYQNSEKFFQTMRRCFLLLQQKKIRSIYVFFKLLDAENLLYKCWEGQFSGNPTRFYKQELSSRKRINYPPFGYLLKVITKAGKSASVSELKIRLDQLTSGKAFFLPEYPGPKSGNEFQCLLSIPEDHYQKISAELNGFLDDLPGNVKIQIEPQ
ncbi:MAG: hypothetical protein PHW04_10105, partial [Candidatus Wallbacteria bacterium]|nr:hypothetical protein [Candidatus Wallbacteria bacterium]